MKQLTIIKRKGKHMKTILLLCLFTLLSLSTWAAPAWPFPFKVKQPDGTVLTVRLHGDEHFNWVTTTDDILLTTKDNAYYVAKIDDDGQLKATTLLAHDQQQRTAAEQTAIRQQAPRRTLFAERGNKTMAARRAPQVTYTYYLPHTGSPRVLVILAAFQDKGFTLTNKSFEQYLNGNTHENYGHHENLNYYSVAKYFETVSHGQFKPQFDIVGPVTLPQNLAYYGGTDSSSGSDEKMEEFCTDAVTKAMEAYPNLDLSKYDNVNNDKVLELVYIIHAGYGQNTTGPANTMWAKVSTFSYVTIKDGYKFGRGGCQSELMFNDKYYEDYAKNFPEEASTMPWINGIGPFIHEFSHGMGLPDLYVTTKGDAKKAHNQSMEAWDVMDYGVYNNGGYRPAAYTAWEQEAMGWITIEELKQPTLNVSLTPVIDGGTAYKIQNPNKPNEYIVLENIQQKGINRYAFGHGLLAYHVDYAYNSVDMGDKPNNTAGHPRVAVIPSGGDSYPRELTHAEDEPATAEKPYSHDDWKAMHAATPFPGTTDVKTLTDEQALPNFCFYSGDTKNPVSHSLFNIKEENGVITFDYDEDSATGIGSPTPALSQEEEAWYTLDGRRLSGEPKQKGIFIYQGKKVVK